MPESKRIGPLPTVSIIIATCARPAALAETLRSLAGVQIPTTWSVELVLVENAAHAGVEGLLPLVPKDRFSTSRYFFEPLKGKSHALNLALAQAGGDILLFTDDDVRFPEDWLTRMCEPIVAGRADAVAGGVRLAPHLLRPWMNRTHRAWLASTADYLPPQNPSEMCGANMAIRRGVFDRIGGFDVELGPGITGGGEESLLSWQLKRAGFRLEGALHVEIEHHPDPERLSYQSWARAARLKGETRAYQLHHWFHETIRFPRLRETIIGAKLFLRSLGSPARSPQDEGIAPWELSYREDMAKYNRYRRERHRPRNYPSHDVRKLGNSRDPAAA